MLSALLLLCTKNISNSLPLPHFFGSWGTFVFTKYMCSVLSLMTFQILEGDTDVGCGDAGGEWHCSKTPQRLEMGNRESWVGWGGYGGKILRGEREKEENGREIYQVMGKQGKTKCQMSWGFGREIYPFLAPLSLHTLMAISHVVVFQCHQAGYPQFNSVLTLSSRDSTRSHKLRAQSQKTPVL